MAPRTPDDRKRRERAGKRKEGSGISLLSERRRKTEKQALKLTPVTHHRFAPHVGQTRRERLESERRSECRLIKEKEKKDSLGEASAKRSRVVRGLWNRLPLLLVLRDDRLRENARAEKLRKREKGASFALPLFVVVVFFFLLRRRKKPLFVFSLAFRLVPLG